MTGLVLDTSVLIADEQGRGLSPLPDRPVAVSVVTLAELELGVHLAGDAETRARRLETLHRVRDRFLGLPIDEDVSSSFAALTADVRQRGRAAPVQDTWIAATALANDAAVCTQDAGFEIFDGVLGLEVLRV